MTTTGPVSLEDAAITVVQPNHDPNAVASRLEEALLEADFDVAPSEVRREETTVEITSDEGQPDALVSSEEEFPSDFAVTIRYDWVEYSASRAVIRMRFRLLDLSSDQVLATYDADGSEMSPVDIKGVVRDFVQQLKQHR